MEGYTALDGGNLEVEPIKSFAYDMTAVMEETEENLKKMKEIFEAFHGSIKFDLDPFHFHIDPRCIPDASQINPRCVPNQS